MGSLEKWLLITAVKYLWRWLFSNENNRKETIDGMDLLYTINRIAEGTLKAEKTNKKKLVAIHELIDSWVKG